MDQFRPRNLRCEECIPYCFSVHLRRGRKVQALLAFMLIIWCLASLCLIIFFLNRSSSLHVKAHEDQALHVQMITGWARSTFDEPLSEERDHPFSPALHQMVKDEVAISNDTDVEQSVIAIKTKQTLSSSPFNDAVIKSIDQDPTVGDPKKMGSGDINSRANPEGNFDELLIDKFSDDKNRGLAQGMANKDGIHCDRSHWRTDICFLKGDLRVKNKAIQLIQDKNQGRALEKIKPYTRKWETAVMENVDEVTIESVSKPSDLGASSGNDVMLSCSLNYSVPAVIFSTGGYSGNVYHDFNDGLIPLYITTRHLYGQVILLILDYHPWWIQKYDKVLQQLSLYDAVNLGNDHSKVHCFREAIVGLRIHDELSIDQNLMGDRGGSMKDFRHILQQAFIPPRKEQQSNYTPGKSRGSTVIRYPFKRPNLVLMAREGSRSLLNQQEVIALAKRIGFQVKVISPTENTPLERIFRELDSCDIMMGVHGAAMTHILFMRPGTVFIQIIPLGTDYPALTYYGEPAKKLGLEYVEYKITAKESSLSKFYKKNDKVLTDPQSIASKGWPTLKKYYLQGQSVKVSLPRLKLILQRVKQKFEHETDKVAENA